MPKEEIKKKGGWKQLMSKADRQTEGPQRVSDSTSCSYIIHFKLCPKGIAQSRYSGEELDGE